jgi:hypothetical protein
MRKETNINKRRVRSGKVGERQRVVKKKIEYELVADKIE